MAAKVKAKTKAKAKAKVEKQAKAKTEKQAKTVTGKPVKKGKSRLGRPPLLNPDGTRLGCSVAGCERDYRCKGYCSAHYQYARAHGWPIPAPKRNWKPPAAAK